ncbi:MAG: hypothetical protein V2A73_17435 [Pseudomonadota bacterium]
MAANKKPLLILGHRYQVVKDKHSDEIAASGRLDVAKGRIVIATNLYRSQAISTTLHEIIEAINWHCELNLEHPKIMMLETALYDILVSNGVKLDPLYR